MSKLLLNEQPLLVMPTLASKIGLNESIVLQQIHYWNQINCKANNNFKDGYYWTFNSYEGWQEQFPFWSSRTIQRTILKLESLQLIIVGNYNKLKIDRTKWYRIDYEVLQILESSPLGQSGTINTTEWLDHLDNLELPLPETNSEINSETKYKPLSAKDEYVSFYNSLYTNHIGRNHPRVSEDNYNMIDSILDDIKDSTSIEEWKETVEYHFNNLPKGNDGNILPFILASKRHFDVDTR